MIYDVFMFNGEYDILQIRYNILKDYVDGFILVEAATTFSGKPKPLYSLAEDVFYDPIPTWEKMRVWEVEENYTAEEIALAESSPNTKGAPHWKHEFLQKESIKKALAHLKDDDIVFISDVDEIWKPLKRVPQGLIVPKKYIARLKLRVYTYYLNNRSDEQFWGGIVGHYGDIKNECLNHLRTNSFKMSHNHGWHFTSMGGPESLKKKLTDSYTEESYATPQVLDNLEKNISESKDFLGRDFTYKIDESEWPDYLKENRQKYIHMLK